MSTFVGFICDSLISGGSNKLPYDGAAGNVLAAIREASIELEGFKQNGEAEPGDARLVAEQFALVRG